MWEDNIKMVFLNSVGRDVLAEFESQKVKERYSFAVPLVEKILQQH
jgi:hypothetical protein